MSKNTVDILGDRCKHYEKAEAGRRVNPSLPLIARLDGHGFSKFTADIQKPFDPRFADLMALTTQFLVEKTQATVGYTQSDEITLIWAPVVEPQTRTFAGRYQKLVSLFAAKATGIFNRKLLQYLPEKENAEPEIDCRVWTVPTLQDAVDVLLWREKDALKNSVSMLASAHFSEKEIDRLSTRERKERLLAKGIDWNEIPAWAQRGRFYRRSQVLKNLSVEEMTKIPEGRRPSAPVLRSVVAEWDLPLLSKISNLTDVIFDNKVPDLLKP